MPHHPLFRGWFIARVIFKLVKRFLKQLERRMIIGPFPWH
jgi:hypothetical protein